MSLVPWSKRNIIPTTPFAPLGMLREEVDDLFGSMLDFAAPFRGMSYPAVNVRDDEKQVTVTAEMPGIDKKDVDIQVNGEYLVLRGERKEESANKGNNWWRKEISYGAFARRIPLPCEVDAAHTEATMTNGVLTVRLAKAKGSKTKTIQIS